METKQEQAWSAIVAELNHRIKEGTRGEVTAISKLLGVTRGTVSRWSSGALKGQRMPFDKVREIMLRLGLDPGLFFGGFQNPEEKRPPGGVPLIGLAACGDDWYTEKKTAILAPRPGDQWDNPEMFAVMACGESMRPMGIEDGFIVYCDPRSKLEPGDAVFIERTNGTMALKVFKRFDEPDVVFESWLPPRNGTQDVYTRRESTGNIKRIVPVIYVKRKP